MKIGAVVMCTNSYIVLGLRFIKKFQKHYKGSATIQFHVFTENDPRPLLPDADVVFHPASHTSWVDGTNSKFRNILELEKEALDYVYYFDADTNVNRDFTEEWFLGELVGTEHFNNRWMEHGKPCVKPYDRHPPSRAYIPFDTPLSQMYYHGALFGGSKARVMEMCKKLEKDQLEDKAEHHEPVWNDESYINHYFHHNPCTRVLPNDAFLFDPSDKGGLGDTRNMSLDVSSILQMIKESPEKAFQLHDGKLTFY